MAIALSLNPAWTGPATSVNLATAAFSPTANSLIIIDSHIDLSTASPLGFTPAITDSVGLTWNSIGTPQRGSSGGWIMTWWAYTATARTNMTVSVNWNGSGANKAIKLRTFTGTTNTNAVISKAQSTSTTNNLTVNVTNTNDGCLIAGSALDWQARGLPTSLDDEIGYHLVNIISGCSVHKAANTSGTGVSVSLNFDGGSTQATDWSYKIYEIVPAVTSGPINVTANQIVETDTAQPIKTIKTKSVGQVGETDTPQIVTKRKVKQLLQTLETDESQFITRTAPIRAVNTVTEIDTAQPITRRRIKTIGLPVELDVAQPIRPIHTRTIGQVTENDTVNPIGKRKLRVVGQTSELDAAQTIKIMGRVFQVVESDTAQSIRVIKRKTLGQTSDSNVALLITPRHRRTIGVNSALELDSPTALRLIKRLLITTVEETNVARIIAARTELQPPPDGPRITVVVKSTMIDVIVSSVITATPIMHNIDVIVGEDYNFTVNL